jgi:hypothetical protein
MYRVTKRKFHTFRKEPVRSGKDKAIGLARGLLQSEGKLRLRQQGALDPLAVFLEQRPPGAFTPDFADLWFLYRTVRSRKPRIIFEFGSGCSTVILAQALWDNQRQSSCSGYLYSVDADPYWAEMTARSLPVSLRECCDVSFSPLLEVEYKGTLGFRHAHIPARTPNLLYLDGPGLTPERQVAMDVLEMEDKLPQDFYMIIDGRRENTLFLQRHLRRRYRFKARRIFRNQVFELIN